ncbi:DHBP synthase RibB-like alpha/beta domain-containing protein [Thelephora terrestris]|uniref:Threonylcarbamoyl-AMP synthase n=1 Tax=Thelephora terrestris TaxID=56493 RepID=A0A9P6H7B4_9AGAM|nr:DHBP synthase RibB-like alpha/beta domain-containing protein [Thelephora terrestris]
MTPIMGWLTTLRIFLSSNRLYLNRYLWSSNRPLFATGPSSSTSKFTTEVISCDSNSIHFPLGSDEPSIDSPETLQALHAASYQLKEKKRCVVFPTETVYGLGALALDSDASRRIFTTKNRPPDNPLIVHVSSMTMLRRLLPPDYQIPKHYEVLIKRFWPGPLTLLFPNTAGKVPDIITAGHPTVAIRMPSHPIARALIAVADVPLAAPSANSSGRPSPTRAEHVYDDLKGRVGIILDGGPCSVGLESTVIDGLHVDNNLRVLRPGGITVEDIEKVLAEDLAGSGIPVPKVLVHKRDYKDEDVEQAPTTPGMKYRHYSPTVPVTLLCTRSLPPEDTIPTPPRDYFSSLKKLAKRPATLVKVGVLLPSDSPLRVFAEDVPGVEFHHFPLGSTSDPLTTAQRLFDGFLTLEKMGVDLILIEEVEEDREGLAVMNRVRKAATELRWLR